MKRCAFLSMRDPTGYVIDDPLAYEPMAALGWRVDTVPWDRPDVDWDRYAVVVVRSPWDYQNHLDAFLEVLEAIDGSRALLANDLALMRWNLDKGYLRDLAALGVPIAPTVWRDRLGPGELGPLFDAVATRAQGAEADSEIADPEIANPEIAGLEIVVKPRVSANADGAFRLDRRAVLARAPEVECHYAQRPLLAQPFARAVLSEGEYSLFYFNGVFSHAISKRPKAGDFRVQEEHGGEILAVTPDPALRCAGDAAMAALDSAPIEPPLAAQPLYARADFVRSNAGSTLWLMEFELVEPALYLRMDRGAPQRFARAIDERVAGAP